MKKTVFILTCLALVVLSGCLRSAPTKFYLLHALENPAAQNASTRQIVLGVGPVELPDYLNRPQIAGRVTPNELNFSEYSRWAEPLERCVQRVLAENMSLLLGTERIELYPWRPSLPIDYQVRVRITRFDGTAGDAAVLIAYWSICGKDGATGLLERKTVISEKAEGGGVEGIVQAQNRALETLSREIAAALQKIAQ
ncbi:MAG: PqiC family protein [Proteobacteria bacterium]|nr:PqiC family protein [Pseudomonadota bacterium]